MMTGAGGTLKCNYVIHTVGPDLRNKPDPNRCDREKYQITKCMKNILKLVKDPENGISSVCIPAISTGIFKFPRELCAILFAGTIKSFIDHNESEMKGKEIVMCNYDEKTTECFKKYFMHEMREVDSDIDSDETCVM